MPVDPATDHTALLVRHSTGNDEDATILLDCGPGIMDQLEKTGVEAGDLTHVFISHQHGDHTLGFPMLLLQRALHWPEQPLTVLAMPSVLDVLERLIMLVYPDLANRVAQAVRFTPSMSGPGTHDLPGAPGVRYASAPGKHSVKTWGVRLDFSGGRSLVYSGDTRPSPPIEQMSSGTSLLIHDSFYLHPPEDVANGHSTAAQAAQLAGRAAAEMLALVHRQETTDSAAADYRAIASQHFAGAVLVPHAGQKIVL